MIPLKRVPARVRKAAKKAAARPDYTKSGGYDAGGDPKLGMILTVSVDKSSKNPNAQGGNNRKRTNGRRTQYAEFTALKQVGSGLTKRVIIEETGFFKRIMHAFQGRR